MNKDSFKGLFFDMFDTKLKQEAKQVEKEPEPEEVLTKEKPYGKGGRVQLYPLDDKYTRAKKLAWYLSSGGKAMYHNYNDLIVNIYEFNDLYDKCDALYAQEQMKKGEPINNEQ